METTASEKKNTFDWIIRAGFLLLVVSVPLYFSFDLTTYTLPKVVLAQMLACVLLAAWFLRMTLEGRYVFKPAALFYPILIYFVISVFSLFEAMSLAGGISLLWQVFAYILVYFVVVNHFREEEMETWVLVLSLVGLLHSGYGILQYFGFDPLL